MSDWFSTLANQAIQFADNLADSLVTQAAEAQQQIEIEQNKIRNEEKLKATDNSIYLPWETSDESATILTQDLMEQILALSIHDENFISRSGNADEVHFNFKEFVPTALRLIELDANLARMHSKLSPKMDEEVFWFNYYCRVVYLREMSGIDGVKAQTNARKHLTCSIVFQPAVRSHEKGPSSGLSDQYRAIESASIAGAVVSKESASRGPQATQTASAANISSSLSAEEQALVAEVQAALRGQESGRSGQGDQSSGEMVSRSEISDGDCGQGDEGEDDDLDLDDLDLLDLGDLDDEEEEEGEGANEDDWSEERPQATRNKGAALSADEDEGGDSDAELEAQIARELAEAADTV